MIDPLVRSARPADVDELRALEAEARAGLVGARGGDRWLEENPEVAWPAVVADQRVIVAELDVADLLLVVGYLVVELRRDVAVVDQVFVTPPARELGFGDAMLEAAADRGRQLGARLIEGSALPGDRETKNLYERAGITARLITVSRPLNGPSTAADASR